MIDVGCSAHIVCCYFPCLMLSRCYFCSFVAVTTYDQLRIPEHLEAGEYVLGFRWDCESSAQVWQSCADITITAGESEE